jgi:hypothetical protein
MAIENSARGEHWMNNARTLVGEFEKRVKDRILQLNRVTNEDQASDLKIERAKRENDIIVEGKEAEITKLQSDNDLYHKLFKQLVEKAASYRSHAETMTARVNTILVETQKQNDADLADVKTRLDAIKARQEAADRKYNLQFQQHQANFVNHEGYEARYGRPKSAARNNAQKREKSEVEVKPAKPNGKRYAVRNGGSKIKKRSNTNRTVRMRHT